MATTDWIFSDAELLASPSQRDGMKHRDELILRRKGCDFIEKMSKPLDLPKLAIVSAQYYFHRFYMRQSFVRYDKYLVAASCVLLGSKVEESPKKIGYIAKEYIAVRNIVEKDQVFAIQKHDPQVIASRIISMEGVLLHAMAYDLTITHPYKFINEKVDKVVRLMRLSEEDAKWKCGKIKQVAWSFVNDSMYTCACLRADPVDLAAAAVYLAGLYENYVPEELCTADNAPWWEILSTPMHTLQDVATYLLAAYADPYIDTQVLPPGLAKLVFLFHPPRSAESPNHVEATVVVGELVRCGAVAPSSSSKLVAASPLCVTSPECGGSQGRSPIDHDFDHHDDLIITDKTDMGSKDLLFTKKRAFESGESSSRRVVKSFR